MSGEHAQRHRLRRTLARSVSAPVNEGSLVHERDSIKFKE